MNIQRLHPATKFLRKKQSVLVLGPRGSGKSYFLKNLVMSLDADAWIVDLLNLSEYNRYLRSPELFASELLQREPSAKKTRYVLIDEIQLIPELLNEIHRFLENHPKRFCFVLTGSSARKLKNVNANLLAGRAIHLPFFPFHLEEVEAGKKIERILQFGTLPKAFLEKDKELCSAYLGSYANLYLQEEIQKEGIVRRLPSFAQFLDLAAQDNGMPINCSKIAKQIHVAPQTIQEYFQILVDTLIAIEIPAWTYSVRQQVSQASKYYFFDNGVLNALTGDLQSDLKPSSYRYGRLFENFVVNELWRQKHLKNLPFHFFHYRTHQGDEVDLVLQKNPASPAVAVEIKSGKSPRASDVKSLQRFLKLHTRSRGFVLCQTPQAYEDERILFLPFQEGIQKVIRIFLR